jgi:hypothetical protein
LSTSTVPNAWCTSRNSTIGSGGVDGMRARYCTTA